MDCLTFLDRLGQLLDGTATPEERAQAERHAEGCAECGELLRAAARQRAGSTDRFGASDAGPDAQSPYDLVGPVLARTAGSACSRAEEILCDFVDGALGDEDATLLAAHLEHCEKCQALAAALTELDGVLAGLTAFEPDPSFLADVLAATTGREAAASWLPAGWRNRLQSLVERPRFAFEVAYVGVVLFVLVFGNPAMTVQAASARTASVARTEISRVRDALPAALSIVPVKEVAQGAGYLWSLAGKDGRASSPRAVVQAVSASWWERAFGTWSGLWTFVRGTVDSVLADLQARWTELRTGLGTMMGSKPPAGPPSSQSGKSGGEPHAPPVR
jgi:anti-sigma factor RsiW